MEIHMYKRIILLILILFSNPVLANDTIKKNTQLANMITGEIVKCQAYIDHFVNILNIYNSFQDVFKKEKHENLRNKLIGDYKDIETNILPKFREIIQESGLSEKAILFSENISLSQEKTMLLQRMILIDSPESAKKYITIGITYISHCTTESRLYYNRFFKKNGEQ